MIRGLPSHPLWLVLLFGPMCASAQHTYLTSLSVVPETISTGDDSIYHFLPYPLEGKSSLVFQVRATNDASVLLSSSFSTGEGDPTVQVYKVVFGGWDNLQSAIWTFVQGANLVSSSTSGLLSGDEYRWLWISWASGRVSVGTGFTVGQAKFMQYEDPCPWAVRWAAVATGFGATGVWQVLAGNESTRPLLWFAIGEVSPYL